MQRAETIQQQELREDSLDQVLSLQASDNLSD